MSDDPLMQLAEANRARQGVVRRIDSNGQPIFIVTGPSMPPPARRSSPFASGYLATLGVIAAIMTFWAMVWLVHAIATLPAR